MGYGLAAETEVVALNAGALLLTAGLASDLRDGVGMALQALGLGRSLSPAQAVHRGDPWLRRRGILAEIVARKRVDVAARLGGFGLEFGRADPAQPQGGAGAARARASSWR